MELDVRSLNREANIFLLSINGRLKSGYLEPLEKEFRRLNQKPPVKVILDVRGVESIDSSGIGELIKARTEITEGGGNIVILGSSSRVEMLIKMSGLDNYFRMASTEAEATELVSRPPDPPPPSEPEQDQEPEPSQE